MLGFWSVWEEDEDDEEKKARWRLSARRFASDSVRPSEFDPFEPVQQGTEHDSSFSHFISPFISPKKI